IQLEMPPAPSAAAGSCALSLGSRFLFGCRVTAAHRFAASPVQPPSPLHQQPHLQPCRQGRRWLRPELRGVYKPRLSPEAMKEFWRLSGIGPDHSRAKAADQQAEVPPEIKRLYQEALPPIVSQDYRDPIVESLHRAEMMRRRRVINIPEFHVGSILAVSVMDKHAPNKVNRFVGLCILRRHTGLFTTFTLRNMVDQVCVQIEYELYSPSIVSIQLLKLERRLDDNLLYLMDAPHSHCTIPFDMVPEPYSRNDPVPVNRERVRLNPPPWMCKWHLHGYQGIDLEHLYSYLSDKDVAKAIEFSKAYKRYDLLDQYLNRVPVPDADYAFKDIFIQHQELLQHQQQQQQSSKKSEVISKLTGTA
ncbi:hypothetical protein BOX15_Mlig004489g3, partial [Macrostomum lignano]